MARITLVGQRSNWLHLAEIIASADLHVTVCETGGPVLETLTLQCPDLIFVDGALADLATAEFVARVRYLAPSLPVVVAVPAESADRLAILEAGASDLLRAPIESLEFVARAHTMLSLLSRPTVPSADPVSLPAKAASEPSPQRGPVIAFLDSLALRPDATTRPHALHLVHLGAVADVNAEFGRAIGDRLLETIAAALRHIASGESVMRVTGDCFAVVQTDNVEPDGISALAGRLARAASGPFEIVGERLSSSTTIGIARFPRDGRSGDAIYRAAMRALLRARAAGLDQTIIEAGDDTASEPGAPYQEDPAAALAQAIGGPDLSLVFQPQVDLATGAFSAAEAFVRWRREGHGNVTPRALFDIAGTDAFLGRLSDEILSLAIAAHEKLSRVGLGDIRISLNISPAQLRLIAAERGTGTRFVPEGRRIEFEIPAVLACDVQYVPALTALRIEGFGLCLDFTGSTALPERPRVAIDRVKIDARAPDCLSTQIAFAQNLQCPVIGGNVEEAGQLVELRALGGQAAQGYYLQRPIPLDEFLAISRGAAIERKA